MGKNYTIGLDIGTNSVGWSVVTENNQLIKKRMKIRGDSEKKQVKKNFWGVRLFDEGETAEATRLKRTTRRRYTRRRNRIIGLQNIFKEEISQKDSNFFNRLNESFLVVADKKQPKQMIFGTVEEEVGYHDNFPTVYHLRKELVDNKEQADIRLVYLAMAHLIKYRGHFLIEGKLSTENTSVEDKFQLFLKEYNSAFCKQEDGSLVNPVKEDINGEEILTGTISRSKKAEQVMKSFDGEKSNGVFSQFLKMIVGNQGNFKKAFNLEEEAKLQFTKEEYDEDITILLSDVGDEYADVFNAAKETYEAIELSGILNTKDKETHAKLSSSMIERYEEHEKDLALLKSFFRERLPEKYAVMFKDVSKNGYAGYIENSNKVPQEEFYKYTKKLIEPIEDASYFIEKMEQETFLRKQRTYDNGVIPHQVHLSELTQIIDNQKKYYPFLLEKEEEIKNILTFKIPYYIGPLAKGNSDFAWLIRNSNDKITSSNINEVLDIEKSASRFIERMTNNDMYLPEEKVLPKNSMLYQKYIVFNELTKVRYVDDRGTECNFSGKEKSQIFERFFKESSTKVKKVNLENYLNKEYMIESPTVKGIEDDFNASFRTYHDFIKLGVSREMLDDINNEEMFEDIIKILTIFEDRQMIKKQLEKYEDVFDSDILKKMARRHYTGWGRLSKKLLHEMKDENSGKTILDYLIEDDHLPKHINRNFMQLINDSNLSFKEKIEKAQLTDEIEDIDSVVKNLTGSPAIKKGISQSLKIVEELVSIIGYQPTSIVVEMARENQTTSKGKSQSVQRYKRLEAAINELGSDLLKVNPTDNQALKDDRLYLYYLQNGRDMYTGAELDIHNLSQYDVDHIIPRSFITDNSIDNRVLVSSKENRGKLDNVPSKEIVQKNKLLWMNLKKSKLMSEKKYANLIKGETGGLTEDDKAKFLNRQLVETRQITKNVAQILDQRFNTQKDEKGNIIRDVKVITLKAALVSQFRQNFEFYKVREVNDFHHAHDAYLNAVVANTLLKVYPKLRPDFVYGEYRKGNPFKNTKATAKKQYYSNIMENLYQSETIIDEETGEILWDKKSIGTIKKVLNYHQVNVVKKVETQTGGFSEETLVPRGSTKNPIALKSHLDPQKYGGFKSPTIAYTIVMEYKKGKKDILTKEFLGISIMNRGEFEKNNKEYLEKLNYKEPRVIMVLPKYSLFELENGRRRLLASDKESQKGNQMAVPSYLNNLLYHTNKSLSKNVKSMEYVKEHRQQFEELLEIIIDFANQFTLAEKNILLISDLYESNKEADAELFASSFINLLRFNQMGAPAEFSFFEKAIPRKRYVSTSELLKGKVIHQSITGLYETHQKV